MNSKDDPRGKLSEGEQVSSQEVEKLRTQVQSMQLEIDILKETLDILKKDPGVDMRALKNQEKAVIVGALRNKYSLPLLLRTLQLSRSSYYYQHKLRFNQEEKYEALSSKIKMLFHRNLGRYGYRRIHALLYRDGICVSEKIIRRIMKECGLVVRCKRRNQRYNSYKGEITPSVPNIIERNFHADAPNKKWLTDVTAFAIPAGKVYLSPMIDCFDGMITAWKISTVPNACLVNDMLDEATSKLRRLSRNLCKPPLRCRIEAP